MVLFFFHHQGRYYDMVLSTKLAGLGHAALLYMTAARDRVGYIYPNVNSAGAGLLMSETFTPDSTNLSDGGYFMYVLHLSIYQLNCIFLMITIEEISHIT